MIFIFLDPSPHTYPTCSWVSQRPLGDPSYTLSFPTADSLKEDKYGLEKGYSHFWPNLENVDLKTKVPQLRVSPTLGRTAPSPTLGSPTPTPPLLLPTLVDSIFFFVSYSLAQHSEAQGGGISSPVRTGGIYSFIPHPNLTREGQSPHYQFG